MQGWNQGDNQDWVSSEALLEKDPLPSSNGCWLHSIPCRRQMRASVSCWLSARSHLEFLACDPLHKAAHNTSACFFIFSKVVRDSSNMGTTILHKTIMYTQPNTSYHLCHILLVGRKSQIIFPCNGGNYTRCKYQEMGVMGTTVNKLKNII